MENESKFSRPVPCALTIAGSDSGGGAGIQADIKTFTSLRVFGMSAITAITAQNTTAVTSVHFVPAEMVAEQIRDVAVDLGVDAAKTGMIGTAEIAEAIALSVRENGISPLVVDPVMISKSGYHLLSPDAKEAVIERLFPLATIVTPNRLEAEWLAQTKIDTPASAEKAARIIHDMGPQWVVLKGGHFEDQSCGESEDLVFNGHEFHRFSSPRFHTRNTHGTGCTFSAAITAWLARGFPPLEAIRRGKQYISWAIQHSFSLGKGFGPVNHFFFQKDLIR